MQSIQKYIYLILKLLFAIAIFQLLVRNAQFKPELLMQFISHPIFLAAVISMFLFQVLLVSWRWSLLNAAQNVNLDFRSTSIATYIGAGFNNILPGAVGGDFVRWYYLIKKIPDKKSAILFSVLLDRILGFIGVIIVALLFSSRMQIVSQNPTIYYPFLVFSILCIAVLVGFFVMILISGKMRIDDYIQRKFPDKMWAGNIVSFFTALKTYHISIKSIIKCLLLAVIIQIIMGITVKVIAEMMGFVEISLVDYIIAASLTLIVNLIPATPGGIGLGEMAFANILILLNPKTNAAFATVYFAYRLVCTLSYLPGVILFIPRMLAARQSSLTA